MASRIIQILFLLLPLITVAQPTITTDTKDYQTARQRLYVGTDTSKYVSTISQVINASSTHRQMPTAKGVYDALSAFISTVSTNATLTGNGSSGSPLGIAQQGATTGRVLRWSGTAWVPAQVDAASLSNTGASAGSYTAANVTIGPDGRIYTISNGAAGGDLTGPLTNLQLIAGAVGTSDISNNAISADKIGTGQVTGVKLAQDGATTGQVLKWNGTQWAPGADTGTTYTGGTGISVAGTVITNSAPDQIVTIAGATGTYPNFTVTPANPAGSSGQIQYNNAGTFGASSSFFWDIANSRLGIGTNAPDSTVMIRTNSATNSPYHAAINLFDLNGNNLAYASTGIVFSAPNNSFSSVPLKRAGVHLYTDNNGYPEIRFNILNGLNSGSYLDAMRLLRTGQVQLPSYTSGSAFTGTTAAYLATKSDGGVITLDPATFAASLNYWTLGSGNVYRSSGKVGIGTATPDSLLTIKSASPGNDIIHAGINLFDGNDGGLGGYSTGIVFSAPNNSFSSTPLRRAGIHVSAGGDGYGFMTFNMLDGLNSGSYLEYGRLTRAGLWGFGMNSPTARVHIKGTGSTSGTKSLYVSDSGGGTTIEALDNRNVGIGGTPSQRLHVYGNARITAIDTDNTAPTTTGTTKMVITDANGELSFANTPTGTVTTTSVVTANGFSGTVATATTTPSITLSTTVSGLLKGNGTAISAATAGTDYVTPTMSANQTITTGNFAFMLDASTASSVISNPFTIRGKADGTNSTQAITFQNAAGTAQSTINITNVGTYFSAVSGKNLILGVGTTGYLFKESGSLQFQNLTVSPSASGNRGGLSYNSTVDRLVYSDGANNYSLATLSDLTNTLSTFASDATPSGAATGNIVDAFSAPRTVTLGSNMIEGRIYTVKGRRNSTNTITVNSESGYTLEIDKDPSIGPTTFNMVSGETITAQRFGTVIIIKR